MPTSNERKMLSSNEALKELSDNPISLMVITLNPVSYSPRHSSEALLIRSNFSHVISERNILLSGCLFTGQLIATSAPTTSTAPTIHSTPANSADGHLIKWTNQDVLDWLEKVNLARYSQR